jgi:hypothetical protein
MIINLDKNYDLKCTLGAVKDIEAVFKTPFFTLAATIDKMSTTDQLKLLYVGFKRANPNVSENEFMDLCDEHLGLGDLMEYLETYLYALQYPGLSQEEVKAKIEKKIQRGKIPEIR